MKNWQQWGLTSLLVAVWLLGGIEPDKDLVVVAGAVMGGWWLLWAVMVRRAIVFPRYFEWFCGLVGVAALSLIWSEDLVVTLRYVVLLASGALWWVGARTMVGVQSGSQVVSKVVRRSILIAGAVFTGLWVMQTLGITNWSYKPSSLVVEASSYKNHNHLGDWWMVIMIVGGMQWWLPGLVMLWACRSRSADLGVMVGWGYLVWLDDWWRSHRRLVVVGGLILVLLFVGSGLQKSTLGARDYYIQTIAGWMHHPWGVGLGNFEKISEDSQNHWWGRDDYSSIVHNLPLEWVVGMGWLGLVGWVWLGLMSWQMGQLTSGKSRLWRGVYWAILINFMFDTTYFLPSMWWLWFVAMGLGEGKNGQSDRQLGG